MDFKRILLLFTCIVLGFLLSELVVSKVLRCPTYGVAYKVRYRIGGAYWTNIRKANAKIYNVEGKIFTGYNNLGLPGIDVANIYNPIAVLGSSYVEALQLPPGHTATSEFQRKIHEHAGDSTVLNLGCSGHDPYDSWFRLKYFERKLGFKTDDVILVLNSDDSAWFKRHPNPLVFELPKDFGRKNTSFPVLGMIFLRNSSSIIELLAKSIKSDDEPRDGTANKAASKSEAINHDSISTELKMCLDAYKHDYKRFVVVSIYNNPSFNDALAKYCDANSIQHVISPIAKPQMMYNGSGHLNAEGNKQLGQMLYEAYTKHHYSKQHTHKVR